MNQTLSTRQDDYWVCWVQTVIAVSFYLPACLQ